MSGNGSGGWVTIDPSKPSPDAKLTGPHHFKPMKRLSSFRYCIRCGHADLRNKISEMVTRIGCGYEDDPRYKTWVAGGCKRTPK